MGPVMITVFWFVSWHFFCCRDGSDGAPVNRTQKPLIAGVHLARQHMKSAFPQPEQCEGLPEEIVDPSQRYSERFLEGSPAQMSSQPYQDFPSGPVESEEAHSSSSADDLDSCAVDAFSGTGSLGIGFLLAGHNVVFVEKEKSTTDTIIKRLRLLEQALDDNKGRADRVDLYAQLSGSTTPNTSSNQFWSMIPKAVAYNPKDDVPAAYDLPPGDDRVDAGQGDQGDAEVWGQIGSAAKVLEREEGVQGRDGDQTQVDGDGGEEERSMDWK